MQLLINNKKLNFKIHSQRVITLEAIDESWEIIENNKLIGLNIENKFIININGILVLNGTKYKVSKIVKRLEGKFTGYSFHTQDKLTKSSNFIMPILGKNIDYYKWNTHFMNAFIGNESDGDYGCFLYLLYKFEDSEDYLKFEDTLKNHPLYNSTIETDMFTSLYRFKLPSNNDIKLILSGKYSKISDSYKNRIKEFNKYGNVMTDILNKCGKRRKKLSEDLDYDIPIDAELYSIFEPHEEIYLNKFKIN